MKKYPIAYLAGPLGFSEVGRLFHCTKMIPIVKKAGFEIRDPWILTPEELILEIQKLPYGQEKKDAWTKLNEIIGKNNTQAICESDIIVAVLDGTDVDSGTAAEIGYATALNKIIIGYRGDFRLSSDNEGSVVNLQIEYFIKSNGGLIVTDMMALETALIGYKKYFDRS